MPEIGPFIKIFAVLFILALVYLLLSRKHKQTRKKPRDKFKIEE